MVGFHLVQIINARLVRIPADRAQGTVGKLRRSCLLRLLLVGRDFRLIVEHPHVEQLDVGLATQQVRLNQEVAQLVAAGEMKPREAERLLGYLATKQLGIEPSRATRFRRQAELRDFGLVEAIEGVPGQPDFEIVPLQDVFEEITSNLSWN